MPMANKIYLSAIWLAPLFAVLVWATLLVTSPERQSSGIDQKLIFAL